MLAKKFPLTVRLLGFSGNEASQLGTALAHPPRNGPSYFCLLGDSLQDPDIYIANGDDMSGLASLVAVNPSPIQPGLVIGGNKLDLPFAQVPRPLDMGQMFKVLADLVSQREDALAAAAGRVPPVTIERRRRIRLDLDITDPAEFTAMRQEPPTGAVLIVDKRSDLREHVIRLLAPRTVQVEWTDLAQGALRICDEQPVALVLINTSTPGIDPYDLCAAIKKLARGDRIAVVLLVNHNFAYDTGRARAAGVRGLLDKPMADRHLLATMKKLLSLS